jgi:hypothetical protein
VQQECIVGVMSTLENGNKESQCYTYLKVVVMVAMAMARFEAAAG